MSVTINERLYRIADALDRFRPHYELAVISGKVADLDRMEQLLSGMEMSASSLVELVTAKPAVRHLAHRERSLSLIAALSSLATAKGAMLLKHDTLHSLVVINAPEDTRSYWASAAQEEVYGLVRSAPEIREALEQTGVLVWINATDRRVRLVNANWLTAHGAIRRFVTDEWPGGRRCRFCRIDEVPTSNELVRVEPDKRRGLRTVNGTVQLQPGLIYAHEHCAPHWQRWLAIAESYPDQEAAEAADREAGRTSASVPPMPGHPESEHAAPAGYIEHIGEDQRT